MRKRALAVLVMAVAAYPAGSSAAKTEKPKTKEDSGAYAASSWSGLEFRGIGPAITEGRIVDLAVDPVHTKRWFIGVASGGVWRTDNAGITWTPVFDGEGSYSIGAVAIDPNNPSVVWVGTGEHNSQRSVGYGDGVYRSDDGGQSWTNTGLKSSEHIGGFAIDTRDSNVVYAAAQGPLWSAGGDRGLYKTTDGGKTWKAVLTISENTGVDTVELDPRDPDVVYATAYQRRRHVWTLIDGGPESAIYKSTDAGKTWKKLENGLPKVDMGRIGLSIAPSDPDTIYAMVEAAEGKGGIYRSTDRGATWEKRSDYINGSPQYFRKVVVDPKNSDRLYSFDVWMKVSPDGGKTWTKLGEETKHPDSHTMWIDPDDTAHLLVGCDGGLYETFDRGATWRFGANLPITQFYRVAVDNEKPFYNVYGGTQDNFSMGGPARTDRLDGIVNSDWFVTSVGDGFFSAVDPVDSNIVYSEAQNGALNRMDRRTGEQLYIQPIAAPGEEPLRWNWDSPVIVSPHDHNRIYFAAQKVFRSDDRGDKWKEISGDLTRHLDRNALPIMGKIWGVDAVAKNASTSFYGNIVALSESPKKEGLLYVGTDDGLIQVTEDGGAHWRRIEKFPGVPDRAYVSRVTASSHDDNVVYAAFDNHKMGDFKPYVLESSDRGRTWTSIAGNLPERGSVHVVVEDPVDPGMLFCGTEFGLFFTRDRGQRWIQLKGGLPTVAVMDIAIQARENDLAIATFGRSFYVLDDYSPLREADLGELGKKALTFSVRAARAYIPRAPLGVPGKAFQGDSFYAAPNPPFGAVLTYDLPEELKTLAEKRRDAEKEDRKTGKTPPYPSLEELRKEAQEPAPQVIATITDSDGHVVRRLTGSVKKGFHRIAWDLRYPPADPTTLKPPPANPFALPPLGPLAVPGRYRASFETVVDGRTQAIGSPQEFEVKGLYDIPEKDRQELFAFEAKTARLQRAVLGAEKSAEEAKSHVEYMEKALLDTPASDADLMAKVRDLRSRLDAIELAVSGDRVAAAHSENAPPSISDRVNYIVGTQWVATSAPTQSSRNAYDAAAREFTDELAKLRAIVGTELPALQSRMEKIGAPWTPGRLPDWKPE